MVTIAQVCPRYSPVVGGIETHVREICERLVKRGFDVQVLTTDSSGRLAKEETTHGVKIRRFEAWAPGQAYDFSPQLRRFLAKNSAAYDILHAHDYHSFPALYVLQTKTDRNRFVFTPHYHGRGHTLFRTMLHVPYRCLGKRIFERADRIVCVSSWERMLVTRDFATEAAKVTVIPNGISQEDFENIERRHSRGKHILCVGRLEKYKGMQHVIRALPMLDSDVFLEIVGEGAYRGSLEDLARRLGVERRIKFWNYLPRQELLQKYADADAFVLLSHSEAYGLCVAEALASGTPCVVANISALKEWVDDRNCFGVHYPIALDELANAIVTAFGKSVDRALPTWDEAASKVANMYEELLDCGHSLHNRSITTRCQ